MNAPFLLTWLAGTLLPLGTLWLVYRLALRGERCFEYNRALLLLAPLLAAALPLLPRPALPLWLNSSAVAVATSKVGVAAVLLPVVQAGPAAAPAAGWSAWEGVGAIYLAGVALGLGRLTWQVGRLWWLARRLPRERRPGYVLAYTGGRLPASSFGRVVFWDETADLPPAEAAAVLAHELAHVQQRHTSDVLWLEAWRAVLWPNPFAHLLLPALRLTHELLADADAAPATGAAAYPTLLARLAARQLGAPAYSPLLQPFTFSFTLTRIAMLQNQNPVRRWKQWLVLPALGGLFFLGSHAALAQIAPMPAEAQQKAQPDDVSRKIRLAERADSLRTGGKYEPGTTQQVNIAYGDKPGQEVVTITRVPIPRPVPQPVTSSGHKVYRYAEQMPQLPGGGGQVAITQAVQSKITYPKAAPGEVLPSGRVFANFTIDTDGTVQDAKIVKGLSPAFDAAVLAAVRQLPRFEPGKQNGQPVAVAFTIPVEFKAKP
ncbi:MAG TPA: TonB family protein [Hymenobacter sp.]|uniref:TonB family protein n=1 Tax=Hymenobacter sp. TaxID=1898978 RepID=UPI002D7FF200|nr:TonB family protein [Hymenobacter sp.]HET9503195.1 TonB family protein [Hymenobacter sp.]